MIVCERKSFKDRRESNVKILLKSIKRGGRLRFDGCSERAKPRREIDNDFDQKEGARSFLSVEIVLEIGMDDSSSLGVNVKFRSKSFFDFFIFDFPRRSQEYFARVRESEPALFKVKVFDRHTRV